MKPDFGRTADDDAEHRGGFPDSFFDRVAALGVGTPGQDVVRVFAILARPPLQQAS